MYLSNKYTEWYNRIISNARSRTTTDYIERHHILPKSMGGSNKKDNIVHLTAREHFVCHLLLLRMTTGENKCKMSFAVWRMCCSNRRDIYRITSRAYSKIRESHAEMLSKRPSYIRTADTIRKAKDTKKEGFASGRIVAWNKGIPRTDKERALMSTRRKAVADNTTVWNKGRPHPAETLAKISSKAQTRQKYKCPHCSREIAGSNYFRWHGDNCKLQHK